jgi:DNA invertase Pin-like site-specific DNA recombinase
MIGILNLVNGGMTMTARLGRNAFTDKERQRIRELLNLGLSVAEIARRFNCSLNPIRRIKKEAINGK